jgi:Na+/H+ antiporter NhaD/arsenite permease-like protein
LDPKNIIIALVLFSNIGGTSTAIGDPPNVIITANKFIVAKGIDFTSFTLHMMFGCVFVYLVCFLYFRLLNSDPNNFILKRDTEFDELKKEIQIWKRTYQSVTPITKGEQIVKTLLKEKAYQLQNLLNQQIYENKKKLEHDLKEKSKTMVEGYKITNKSLLIKCILIFSVTLFLVNNFNLPLISVSDNIILILFV